LRKYVHDHPGVVITLVYFYLSIVGLIYQYFHLKGFGVSVFDFSVTQDYLIAFLKALPFLLGLLFIHFLILIKDVIFNQKHAPGETFRERCHAVLIASRKLELALLLLSLPVFAWLAGDIQGDGIEGHDLVDIEESTAKKLGVEGPLYLFDTTQGYLFLADENSRIVVKRDDVGALKVSGFNKTIQPTAEASAD
jgi:hypothetical protein